MCAAYLTSISLACFDIVWAQRGALDPEISVSFENYDESPEEIQFILKVRFERDEEGWADRWLDVVV